MQPPRVGVIGMKSAFIVIKKYITSLKMHHEKNGGEMVEQII